MKRILVLLAMMFALVGNAFAEININSATAEQLDTLKGIGPVKAKAIIDYRTKNGPFKSLEDIKKVDGIGDATFDAIKKDIALTGTSKAPAAAPAKAAEKSTPPPAAKSAGAAATAPAMAKGDSKASDAPKSAKAEAKAADAPKAAKAEKAEAPKAAKAAKDAKEDAPKAAKSEEKAGAAK